MSQFVCLMYHNVCRADQLGSGGPFAKLGPSIRSYSVTTGQFDEQIGAIDEERWMDPEELRRGPIADDRKPRVLITFDDGWAGSINEAGPILADAGVRAILFVTTGLIGHPLFATERMLRDLPSEVFEIGAHTVTHPFLAECSTEQIARELRDSRTELEEIVGRPVDTMSVPNGSLDDRVMRIAAECGYSFVFTSQAHVNDGPQNMTAIGRVAVRSTTTREQLVRWSDGQLGGAGWRRRALEVPRRALGPDRYRRLRGWALGEGRNDDDMAELVASHRRNSQKLVSTV